MKVLWGIAILVILTGFCRADETAQAVLQEINLARTNPAQYAQLVLTQADGRSQADQRAMREAVNFLQHAKPLPPLGFSNGLSMGAAEHVTNQGGSGAVGHEGTDRSSPWQRMAHYGRWTGTAGENISYGVSTPRQIVISLIVDAGVSNRGHRKNIFSRDFGVAGVASGYHARWGTMCVMDFAGGFTDNAQITSTAKTQGTATARLAWNGPI